MGQGSLAKLIKVRQLVKWEGKFDDLLHRAGATTNNNLHRNTKVNGWKKKILSRFVGLEIKLLGGVYLGINCECNCVHQTLFPCLMKNIIVDIPSININAPF